MENVMTTVQVSVFAEDDASQENRIVEANKREENVRACICDWTELISELYN